MKMRICTCYGMPVEAFTLTLEEQEFFGNDPNDFLSFINKKIYLEMKTNKQENERLKKELEEK